MQSPWTIPRRQTAGPRPTEVWRFAAARATGATHLKRNEVCQDRYSVWSAADVFVAAVADGAGSASRAEAGAKVAVDTAMEHIRTSVLSGNVAWGEIIRAAADAGRSAIVAVANDECRSVRDFACTLLLVISSSSGGAALQIGDGVIALKDNQSGGWSWVFWPQKGEYANMTRFLVDPDAMQVLESVDLPRGVFEVVLMTDGLEALALDYSDRTAHEPFFEGVLAPLRTTAGNGEILGLSAGLGAFLASQRVMNRTDDDLTLVLAARPMG